MLRYIFSVPAALALVATPAFAQAESCYSLQSQDDDLKNRALDLATNNPGTALVTGGCTGVAMNAYQSQHSDSDALGAFVTCAGVGCAFTDSYSNCISVGSQLIILALRGGEVEARMRRQGCRL